MPAPYADALTVPDAAVLRDTENQPFVYVQSSTKQNEFARRLVKLGDSHGGRTQIAGGLKEGESVVGDGSLFLQFKNSCSTKGDAAERNHDDPSHCSIRPAAALPHNDYAVDRHRRRRFFPPHARGRLSGSLSAHGRTDHAVARPCRRRSGTPHYAAARTGHERHAEHAGDAFHFALRPFRRHSHL